ncbi:MAG: PorV/PorQ family protein, partial [Phycisphaerales bacterium]|nr:PorV/PorQ family protein [Phycisphaerales bacterium]
MRIIALAVLLVLASGDSRAAETASFLDIGVGARGLGMGEAYTALADDANALYWNPAGLSRLEKREFAASHAELFESTRLDSLAYAHPTSQGTFAAGVTYLSQGKIDGRDSFGRQTAGYSASDAAMSLGYARKLDMVDVGASVKYIRSHIGSAEAQGVAVDVGTKRSFDRLTVGAAVRNLGPGLKFQDQRNDLPLRVAAGAGYAFSAGHAAAAEVVGGPRGTGTNVSLGGEFQAVKSFYLRAGYTTRTAVPGGSGFDAARGLTMGLGFRSKVWSLDYAITPSGELGRGHRRQFLGRERRHRNVGIDSQPVEPDHAGRHQADGRAREPARDYSH